MNDYRPPPGTPTERAITAAFRRARQQENELRRNLPEGMRQLATLFFTHEELVVLGDLVDQKVRGIERVGMSDADEGWLLLNSLRTALREAQFSLETR